MTFPKLRCPYTGLPVVTFQCLWVTVFLFLQKEVTVIVCLQKEVTMIVFLQKEAVYGPLPYIGSVANFPVSP